MIEIVHRESEEVILTVAGEWRQRVLRYAFLDGIDLHTANLVDADFP